MSKRKLRDIDVTTTSDEEKAKDMIWRSVIKSYELTLSMECPLRCCDDGKQKCAFHTGDMDRLVEQSQGIWKYLAHSQPQAAKILKSTPVPVRFH